MNYKRTKTVVTTLFDGQIENKSEITNILRSLSEHMLDLSLKMKNESPVARVRILSTTNDYFTYKIIGRFSSLQKAGRYEDIDTIEVNSNDEFTARTRTGITRWSLINPAEDFEISEDGRV